MGIVDLPGPASLNGRLGRVRAPGTHMTRFDTVEDLHRAARRRLSRAALRAVDAGAGTGSTASANEAELRALRLRPRVGFDVSRQVMRADILGREAAMPLALAPAADCAVLRPGSELAAARAAARRGLPFVLSAFGATPVEQVAAAAPGRVFLQLAPLRDRGALAELVERAARATCTALMLSLMPALPLPSRSPPRGLFSRAAPAAEPATVDPAASWGTLEWLRARWSGPLLVKGIIDPQDAALAADCGADAVVVSNHGGRHVDGAPSTAAALPAVVDAVSGRTAVWIDGGVRGGGDVVRALALGASAAMICRPWLWALAAGGEAGVARCIDIFRDELAATMAWCGASELAQIDRRALF